MRKTPNAVNTMEGGRDTRREEGRERGGSGREGGIGTEGYRKEEGREGGTEKGKEGKRTG